MIKNKTKKFFFFIPEILIFIIVLVLTTISIFNENKEEKEYQEKLAEGRRPKEYYDNLKSEVPKDFEELEATEKIDVLGYKNKEIEFYNLMNDQMPKNVIDYFENLKIMQQIINEYYEKLHQYSELSTVDGMTLKRVLKIIKTCNSKIIEDTGQHNDGIYLLTAISAENINNKNDFRGHFNDLEKINELIDIIKDNKKYNIKIIRKYSINGIICLHLKIYDEYDKNANYVRFNSIEPAHLTFLDKSLFDILMINEPVDGSVVKFCLNEVIKYNSMRNDTENAIRVEADISNDEIPLHQYEIHKIEDLKRIRDLIEEDKVYDLLRNSGGVNTKYGYMYTYKIIIKEIK